MNYNQKSQSALEYMMTYGWAILIIVIVAAVLYSLGIFSPSSSLSATVTGFSGFVGTQALCSPYGVLILSLNNAVGNLVFVKYANSTLNGKTYSSNVSEYIAPGDTGKMFILGGCINVSNAHFSSKVEITYTEPGQALPGPYISVGYVTGTTSSFIADSVANFSNASSAYIPDSKSFNSIWDSGHKWTLVGWFYTRKIWNGNTYLIQEVPGCTSGLSSYQYNSTYFEPFNVEWNNSADTCSDGTTADSYPLNQAPYDRWEMITGIFSFNAQGNAWLAVCVDTNCQNMTWTLNGPANYSDPNPYNTILAGSGYNGMVANIQAYDTSFSLKDVQTLYGLGLGGIPIDSQNLIAWIPFDGNANDYSGNGNDALTSNVVYVNP